ncbi:MAG TPA: peptidase, partial [Candidatus Tectomicrobia bacterium]|nr:peptidase [Candidatus Tectomicrobia bacterium]
MTTIEAPISLRVPPEDLRRTCDPESLGFETTAEVPPLEGTVGQDRAINAIEFALNVKAPGYNLYVAGYPGTG